MKVFLTFLFFLQAIHLKSKLIQPEEILISFTIDMGNDEIVQEGLRAVTSLFLFGENIRSSYLDLCLIDLAPMKDIRRSNEILHRFKHITDSYRLLNDEGGSNRISLRYVNETSIFPNTNFSPTLNKLCSFESAVILSRFNSIKYFLYLDADIFVLQDPLDHLNQFFLDISESPVAIGDIYCSRPWNSFLELEFFLDFVELLGNDDDSIKNPESDRHLMKTFLDSTLPPDQMSFIFDTKRNKTRNPAYPFLETLSIGGRSLHGLCNTGMLFMTISAARDIFTTALSYLNKVENFSQSFSARIDLSLDYISSLQSFYSLTRDMIDSIVLWASIYYLQLEVILSPIEMNFIIPAGDALVPFVSSVMVDESTGQMTIPSPYFLHVSKGSDLMIDCQRNDNLCFIELVTNGISFKYYNDTILVNQSIPFNLLTLSVFKDYLVPKISQNGFL